MRRIAVPGLIWFACTAAWSADPVVSLNLKPGTWETSITVQTSGKPPISAAALANLTPAQRARVEAAQSKAISEQPTPDVAQNCLTKEDLAKPSAFGSDPGCKVKLTKSSPSGFEGSLSCQQNGTKTSGTMRVEAPNPEEVKFEYQLTTSDGAHTMKINSTGAGRWLSASCDAK